MRSAMISSQGSTVFVVQRVAGGHLGFVRAGVQVVAIDELEPSAVGEGRADSGLSRAGDAHHDEWRTGSDELLAVALLSGTVLTPQTLHYI